MDAPNKTPGRGDGAGAVFQGTDAADDTPLAAPSQPWGRYQVNANGVRYSRLESAADAEKLAAKLRSYGWHVRVIDRAPTARRLPPHQPDLFD